jgi:hypothetical protein
MSQSLEAAVEGLVPGLDEADLDAEFGRALPASRRAEGPSRLPAREKASASIPRVLVPEEDARVVRRLARRLRGRAARAAVLGPGVEGPFDFTLKPIEGAQDLASNDERGPGGFDPAPRQTPSFDRMLEEAGRET